MTGSEHKKMFVVCWLLQGTGLQTIEAGIAVVFGDTNAETYVLNELKDRGLNVRIGWRVGDDEEDDDADCFLDVEGLGDEIELPPSVAEEGIWYNTENCGLRDDIAETMKSIMTHYFRKENEND